VKCIPTEARDSTLRRCLPGVALLIGLSLLTPTLAAQTTRGADEAGLYLYLAHPGLANFDALYSAGLTEPYIDGAAIIVQWAQLEPRPEVYDWSILDKWALKTVLLHKQLSVGVSSGLFAPEWIYGAGYRVPKNSFDFNRSGNGISCVVLTQPSFWNPVYLGEYRKMIAAMSEHLRALKGPDIPPGAVYQALRVVKLSGINITTEELKVDTTPPDTGPCHQSDATAIWAEAGFTPAKTVSAFMTLAADTSRAFPEKLLSLSVIHRNAFPPIDDNGHVYSTIPIPDVLTARILASAIPIYRSRLLVQWNALWQGGPPTEVLAAGKQGARIGWQMNGFRGDWTGSGCIYPGFKIRDCETVADFQSILDNGIDLGGRYIEVQGPSVGNKLWEPAFQAAHDRLLSKPIS